MGEDAQLPWTPRQKAAIIAELRSEFPGRQLYPIQRGNPASQWELVAHLARLQDASSQDPRKSRVPPTLAALITAVRQTRLSPGAVGPGTRTLTTHDPDKAAAEVERLLSGWAWSGQES